MRPAAVAPQARVVGRGDDRARGDELTQLGDAFGVPRVFHRGRALRRDPARPVRPRHDRCVRGRLGVGDDDDARHRRSARHPDPSTCRGCGRSARPRRWRRRATPTGSACPEVRPATAAAHRRTRSGSPGSTSQFARPHLPRSAQSNRRRRRAISTCCLAGCAVCARIKTLPHTPASSGAAANRTLSPMDRRKFLRASALGVGAVAFGPLLAVCSDDERRPCPRRSRSGPIASSTCRPPTAPIDTIVVVMMENRSFDHYLGWLGDDEAYLEAGRSRYGPAFRVDATTSTSSTRSPRRTRRHVLTSRRLAAASESVPRLRLRRSRATAGTPAARSATAASSPRAATTTSFALGYYDGRRPAVLRRARAPLHASFDRYHCSVLGPTYPNREYLHSAQSRRASRATPSRTRSGTAGFTWPTIWDRLVAAGVPARYYYTDLPVPALWGIALSIASQPDRRLLRGRRRRHAAERRRSSIPAFLGADRTDEHPHGDVRDGQRFVQSVVQAFAESPHWERGAVHPHLRRVGWLLRPRRAAASSATTARARDDQDNFGQAGFRVPTRMISPYARPGFVDHHALRPHVDPALHRVALPRRAARGHGRAERDVVPDQARPRREQPRRLARHRRRSRARLRARPPDPHPFGRVPCRRRPGGGERARPVRRATK